MVYRDTATGKRAHTRIHIVAKIVKAAARSKVRKRSKKRVKKKRMFSAPVTGPPPRGPITGKNVSNYIVTGI